MSMQVKGLIGTLIGLLSKLEPHKGASNIVSTPPSQVKQDNAYRFILNSIRNDLFHFDEDKRERIIYNIQTLIQLNPPEIKDLIATLERVIEVVKRFKGTGDILQSPIKQATPSSKKKICKTTTVRKQLFT